MVPSYSKCPAKILGDWRFSPDSMQWEAYGASLAGFKGPIRALA